MDWELRCKKVIVKVASELDIPYSDLDNAVYFTFKKIRECLQKDTMPKVYIEGFGTFLVPAKVLWAALNNFDNLKMIYKSPEERIERKEQLTQIYKRRYAEELKTRVANKRTAFTSFQKRISKVDKKET